MVSVAFVVGRGKAKEWRKTVRLDNWQICGITTPMIIQKITNGFVVQRFDSEKRRFISQEFIAADGHEWENELGENIENDDEGREAIYGKGGVDEPELALEMKQPAEIKGIYRFNVGDKVLATPDQTGDTWNEFQGTVRGFRQGNLVTVEDQDGDCFDCYPDQLESLEEKDRTKD